MKYELKEINKVLREELKESFPNNWRDKYYTVMGYLIAALERLK